MNSDFPFLTLERTRAHIQVDSKKRVIELLSELLVQQNQRLDQEEVYRALLTRERLGTTAIGHGVALPHSCLPGLIQPIAAFITLKNPIEFDAYDNKAVDLFYALLVPSYSDETKEQENQTMYLEYLAYISAIFKQIDFRKKLRQVKDHQILLSCILNFCEQNSYESLY